MVDTNQGGDPREQLAQQLLAFVFNTKMAGIGAVQDNFDIDEDGDTTDFVSVDFLNNWAITAWGSGTGAEQIEIKDILDAYNNNDAVIVVLDPILVL